MAERASAGQRNLIRDLIRRAEFDPQTVTFMYRRLGTPDALIGRPVDEWLGTLSMAQASTVITKLKDIACVEEEDED